MFPTIGVRLEVDCRPSDRQVVLNQEPVWLFWEADATELVKQI